MLNQDEIKKLSDDKLKKELEKARTEHYRLKVGVRTKHLKNSHEAKKYQKYVARLLTEMNARRIEAPATEEKKEEAVAAEAK